MQCHNRKAYKQLQIRSPKFLNMSSRSHLFVEEQSILFIVIVSHDPIGLQALAVEVFNDQKQQSKN